MVDFLSIIFDNVRDGADMVWQGLELSDYRNLFHSCGAHTARKIASHRTNSSISD